MCPRRSRTPSLRRRRLGANRIFDQQHYDELNAARKDATNEVLGCANASLGLKTALDVGCGVGYFCDFLAQFGLAVTGVEGRAENAEEARRRNPAVNFHVMNAEDEAIRTLGTFDLVFCFGLLYHLENPLRAVRNLRSLAGKLLLVEGLCYPSHEPVL